MDIIHVATFFLLPSGKSNCDPSQRSRPTAPQSILNGSNHNFLYGCAVIILLFTSLTEISSCFLQLSKRSFRTRVKSLSLYNLCIVSFQGNLTQTFEEPVDPPVFVLVDGIQILLHSDFKQSWKEEKKDRETDTNDYWPPSLSSGAPPPCQRSSPLRACWCSSRSWMNQPNICVSMKTSRKRRTVLDGMALRKPSRWKKQGTGEEEEEE